MHLDIIREIQMTGEQLTEQLKYLALLLMWVVESLESTYKTRPCGNASTICLRFCFHVFSVLCSMQVKEMLIPVNRWFCHRFFYSIIGTAHGRKQEEHRVLVNYVYLCPVQKKNHNCIPISFEKHY